MLTKTLTIGIPTYNNPVGIKNQLEYYIKETQNNPISNKIEILVSDNSDDNKTKDIINSFVSKIPELTYIKNKRNIGFDRNVDQVLTMAKGTFCWTLSDNDLIKQGSIEKLVRFLENKEDVGHILMYEKNNKNREQIFENMESFIEQNNYKLIGGLISRNIFNTKFLPQNRSKYYDNWWFHVSLALEIGSQKRVSLMSTLLEESPEGVCSWAKNGTTFITYTSLHSIIMNLKNFNYSKEFLETYHIDFIRNLPHQIVTARLYGLKCTKKNIKILYKSTKENKFIFILGVFILVTPIFILKIARKVWKKL